MALGFMADWLGGFMATNGLEIHGHKWLGDSLPQMASGFMATNGFGQALGSFQEGEVAENRVSATASWSGYGHTNRWLPRNPAQNR